MAPEKERKESDETLRDSDLASERVEARRGQHVSLHSSASLWCNP